MESQSYLSLRLTILGTLKGASFARLKDVTYNLTHDAFPTTQVNGAFCKRVNRIKKCFFVTESYVRYRKTDYEIAIRIALSCEKNFARVKRYFIPSSTYKHYKLAAGVADVKVVLRFCQSSI